MNIGLKKILKMNDISMIKDAIDLSWNKTVNHFKTQNIMDPEQLKIFFKFLKVFFEMWNVCRQLNDCNEIEIKLDAREFHRATSNPWFKKNGIIINDDNYLDLFYKICGKDE